MTALTALGSRVSETARTVHPALLLLTVLAVPFFAAGWLAGMVVRVVGMMVAWAWAAVLVGWRDVREDR